MLGEGITDRASDLDLIYTFDCVFPTSRGGPVNYADTRGLATIRERLETLRVSHGDYWTVAPLIALLCGQTFANFDASTAETLSKGI